MPETTRIGAPQGPRAEPRLRFHEASAEIGAKVFGYDAARAARHDTQVLSNALSRDMRGAELQSMSERMQVFFVRRIVEDLSAGPKRIDRFLEDGRPARFFRDGRRITMPTLPFGGGVSMCPGRHFAQNEIKILVATLLLWLDAELCSFAVPELDFSRIGLGILPPKQDVELLVRLRASR